RALPLQPGDEVVRQAHALERRAEHEFARGQDERRLVVDLDELGQLLLLLLDVDERVPRVAEDPEIAVDAHIQARRLHQRVVVGVDFDPSLVEKPPDRDVAENHARILRSVAKRTFSTYCSPPVSMLFEQMEPNERFRARREAARRRRRRRRAVAFGLLLGVTATATLGARFVIDDEPATTAAVKAKPAGQPAPQPRRRTPARAPPDQD